MKQKKFSIGKILVFLSFFIIIIGAIISIGEKTGYVDTSNNIVVPHSDDKITITTTKDGEELIVNNSGLIVSADDKNTNNNNNTGNNNQTSNGNTSNNNQTQPTPTKPPTPAIPVEDNSIESQNQKLRTAIYNQYGITVLYGSETNGYSVGGLSTSIIADPGVINSELNTLKDNLGLYPSGFFKEITNSIPLTLYLIQSYSNGGVCGVTDSNYTRAIMSLAAGSEFVETFHHENYHYMERYIFKKGGDFSSWVNYNPPGFVYGQNKNYAIYNVTFQPDSYFVNVYARDYDEFEDRASVFEYMMAGSKASCLNAGMPVNKKATYISSVIENNFNTVIPGVTEYWERFIK